MPNLKIYGGDPKTNTTRVRVLTVNFGGAFVIAKVCGFEYTQGVSLATSGFDSLSADVPAQVLYFSQTKVTKRIIIMILVKN
jgi:hypothetical protein